MLSTNFWVLINSPFNKTFWSRFITSCFGETFFGPPIHGHILINAIHGHVLISVSNLKKDKIINLKYKSAHLNFCHFQITVLKLYFARHFHYLLNFAESFFLNQASEDAFLKSGCLLQYYDAVTKKPIFLSGYNRE